MSRNNHHDFPRFALSFHSKAPIPPPAVRNAAACPTPTTPAISRFPPPPRWPRRQEMPVPPPLNGRARPPLRQWQAVPGARRILVGSQPAEASHVCGRQHGTRRRNRGGARWPQAGKMDPGVLIGALASAGILWRRRCIKDLFEIWLNIFESSFCCRQHFFVSPQSAISAVQNEEFGPRISRMSWMMRR